MKANKAPEKIYIPTILAANVVRYKEEGSIEYTRTDTFIEKACAWLRENIYQRVYKEGDALGFPTAEFIEEFRKYMKGE